jgi:hypothetical protein
MGTNFFLSVFGEEGPGPVFSEFPVEVLFNFAILFQNPVWN